MKKDDLAERLARNAQITKAEAADQLDGLVHQILRNLRKGEAASLPGLGTFTPGRATRFRFDSGPSRPAPRTKKS